MSSGTKIACKQTYYRTSYVYSSLGLVSDSADTSPLVPYLNIYELIHANDGVCENPIYSCHDKCSSTCAPIMNVLLDQQRRNFRNANKTKIIYNAIFIFILFVKLLMYHLFIYS